MPLIDSGEMSRRTAVVVYPALRVPKNVTWKRTGIGIEDGVGGNLSNEQLEKMEGRGTERKGSTLTR
jgi:hypothetical protein